MDRSEWIASVALVALGLSVTHYAHRHLKIGMLISPGAGFLPFCIGIALVVLGLVWLFQALCARRAPAPPETTGAHESVSEAAQSRRARLLRRLLPGVLLVVVYAWLLEKAGYLLSTTLFMVGWQKAVERENWLKAAVVALLSAGGMYILFSYLLKVFLPTGIWFD